MKTVIFTYWNSEVKAVPPPNENGIEEKLKRGEKVTLCDIKIDGRLKGSVVWNGKDLTVEPP